MGIWLGESSRGESHLIFDDEVVQERTAKRMPEERRWQAKRVLRLDALPWLLRPQRVKERATQQWQCYITWNYIPRYGGTPGFKACTRDSTHHNKQCVERCQKIFDREDAEAAAAAVARAGAEVGATPGQEASASSGDAPPVVSLEAADATTVGIPAENETSACGAGSLPMENAGGPSCTDGQGGRGDAFRSNVVLQETWTPLQVSPTARRPNTLQVFRFDTPYEEPDIGNNPVNDQEDSDEDESGVRCSGACRTGASLPNLRIVVEVVSNGQEGIHVPGPRTPRSHLSAGAASWRSSSQPVLATTSLRAHPHH